MTQPIVTVDERGMTVVLPADSLENNDQAIAMQNESNSIVDRIKGIAITDQATYDQVVALGRECREIQKRIEAFYAPHKANAYKSWKDICTAENRDKEAAEKGYKEAKSKAGAWEVELERAKRKALRDAEEAQRKRMEEEALERAAAAQAAGASQSEVDAVVEEGIREIEFAPIVPAASALPQFERAKGFTRSGLEVEVTDLKALIADIATRPDLSYLLRPDESAIKTLAKRQGATFALAGVKITGARS